MIDYDALEAGGLCECGHLLEGHPPLPKPLPWGHGRPCTRDRSGTQFTAGSSFLERGPRRVEAQEAWGHSDYVSAKAHAPTPDQQFTIVSKAIATARPR